MHHLSICPLEDVVLIQMCAFRTHNLDKFRENLCEIARRWIPQSLLNEKSTLVQVMPWWRHSRNHYLKYWPRCMSSYDVTTPHWVKKNQQLYNSWTARLLDSHFAIWFILAMRHTLCAISNKVMNVALLLKGNSLTLKQMARFLWESGQSTFHSILRWYSILALMPERHKVWMNTYVLLTFDWPTEIGHLTMLIISSQGNFHPLHICCHE